MLLMFGQGTQGSITQAVHRYTQANNKYMEEWFDPGKESCYLQYLITCTVGDGQNLSTGGVQMDGEPRGA